jgi:hypothetical protein
MPTLVLERGARLGPFTVGSGGAWKIDADGTLDVHACLFFDGNQLYIASGSEERPPLVNGTATGTEWIAVPMPARIAMGSARIDFKEDLTGHDDLTAVNPDLYLGASRGRAPVALNVHATPTTVDVPGEPDLSRDTSPWFMLNDVTTVGPCVVATAARPVPSRGAMVVHQGAGRPGLSPRVVALALRPAAPLATPPRTARRRAMLVGAGAALALAASTIIALLVHR